MKDWTKDFEKQLSEYDYIELGRTLEEGMPTYPTHPKFSKNDWYCSDDPAEMHQLILSDHTGTHVDSPSHFVKDKTDQSRVHIDQLPLKAFTGRLLTIHFKEINPDYGANHGVTVEEILQWELKNDISIEENDILFFDFGWAPKWGRNQDGDNFLKNWPGLGATAVKYLLCKKIKAVGTDCIGMDTGNGGNGKLPAHYGLLPTGVLIYENLYRLNELPLISYFVAMPLLLKKATGSPIRPIAVIKRNSLTGDSVK